MEEGEEVQCRCDVPDIETFTANQRSAEEIAEFPVELGN